MKYNPQFWDNKIEAARLAVRAELAARLAEYHKATRAAYCWLAVSILAELAAAILAATL